MKPPRFWYRPFGWHAALLWPLSLGYALGRALHVSMTRPVRFKPNVICVGNLVAGGAGKTPTVLALADLLRRHGVASQIVTRGFGGAVAAPRRVQPGDDTAAVGDEALLLADVAPAWVAPDRGLGIGCALAAGAAVVLLDDGLQSPGIRAGTNLLVIDGASGLGNGALLPAGPLRESIAAVRARIDGIILIGGDETNCLRHFPDRPVFRADPHYDLSRLDRTAAYVAFAGLARPEKFFKAALAQGLTLVGLREFADHHPYSAADRAALQDQAHGLGARLLTTAKDAVRWPDEERVGLAVLPLRLRFADEAALAAFLKGRADA